MKGYWIIFGGAVSDPQAQQEYGRLWAPIAEQYGATLRKPEEGALVEVDAGSRVLIVEFPSHAQALACYNDPAYTQAKAFALQAAHRELIIIEGDLG